MQYEVGSRILGDAAATKCFISHVGKEHCKQTTETVEKAGHSALMKISYNLPAKTTWTYLSRRILPKQWRLRKGYQMQFWHNWCHCWEAFLKNLHQNYGMDLQFISCFLATLFSHKFCTTYNLFVNTFEGAYACRQKAIRITRVYPTQLTMIALQHYRTVER